ncbi:RNA polymerase sigma factor [Dyadobacter tibetensis]|uniref:RNA polymerase sigma factor n=1 Tax=Dyadobacter tibetensis TaxID=1211851 RepID=UPI0004B3DAE0|nr:sigma-70 family RNA polymerase sigma factor [Dyadobacter tibetensis]
MDAPLGNERQNMAQRLAYEEAQNLWQEYKDGDITALGKIMEGYYSDLFNWGLRFNADREMIKDCIQETFLTLWKKQETIRTVENVRAYLMVMIKRRVLSEKNKQQGDVAIDRIEGYEFLVEFAPDLRLIEEEHEVYQIKKLSHHINRLPNRQKEVIYLRFYQNQNFEQIAETMQLGRQSVYNLFHKSLKSLRENWAYGTLLLLLWWC